MGAIIFQGSVLRQSFGDKKQMRLGRFWGDDLGMDKATCYYAEVGRQCHVGRERRLCRLKVGWNGVWRAQRERLGVMCSTSVLQLPLNNYEYLGKVFLLKPSLRSSIFRCAHFVEPFLIDFFFFLDSYSTHAIMFLYRVYSMQWLNR